MNIELAIAEAMLSLGFLFFGFQRWKMGYRAASMMCLMLALYFGRICTLYTGRALGMVKTERVIDHEAILFNAILLLLALALAVLEAHEIGYRKRKGRDGQSV